MNNDGDEDDFIASHSSGGGNSQSGAATVWPHIDTCQRRVLFLLRDNKGERVPVAVINEPTLGGTSGDRRAREMRDAGWNIDNVMQAWTFNFGPEVICAARYSAASAKIRCRLLPLHDGVHAQGGMTWTETITKKSKGHESE